MYLRGRVESISLHEVFDSDPPALIAHKTSTKAVFEAAIRAWFAGDRRSALAGLNAILATGVADAPAEYYRGIITAGQAPTAKLGAV